MSLFGKKGSDDSEAARQLAIKQSLNRELSTGIKTLQRDHISSDSAIRSGDTANRICNVLEAIFLHELKDSYASKLSSWSSILAPPGAEDNVASVSTSFWAFVVKFTHKDVVSQIKALSLINSEVGHCRAWIRMGLNDCLMDSYVDAMLSDAKTIKTYYKRSSFLRDSEQPHIMKNYLQGLGNFAFQLSYNSSVLNIWGAAPMIAAGSWAPPKDSPVSEPSTPRGVGLSGTGLVHQYSDPTSTYSRAYSAPKSKQADSPLADPPTPHAVPRAIDGSFHESEISSNLLHSPPDDDGPLVVAMATENKKQISPHKVKKSNQDKPIPAQDVAMHHGKDVLPEQQIQKQEFHRPEEDNGRGGFGESKNKKVKPDTDYTDSTIEYHIIDKCTDDSVDSNMDNSYAIKESDNLIPPNPFEEASPVNPFDEPEDKVGEKETVSNPFDEAAVANPFDEASNSNTIIDESENTNKDSTNQKGASDIDNYGRSCDKSDGDRYGRPLAPPAMDDDDSIKQSVGQAVLPLSDQQERQEDDDKHGDFEDSFQGNSLGARSGWSSSFEQQANTPTSPEAGPEALLPGATASSKTALASYKSLLEDYAAQGTTGALPETNWEALLGQVPGTEPRTPPPTSPKNKEGRLTSISGLSEADISAEYEVIPFSSSPTSKYADTRTQGLLNIVTVIGREKGLDSQNYQCKGCSRPVGIIYGKANVCSYDGGYYCYECHTDDEAIIPAKILYSWDFRKHKVSKHTKVFLQQIEAMPLVDVEECNPSLYKAIPELSEIRILRSQLKYLKAYLFTCQQSVAEELRKKVWPREYMLDHMHLYSTQDFLQIQVGNLTQFLKRVIVFAAKHVQQCALCSQKGFICEICTSDKVIYPFDVELTVRCDKCTTVFHKACKTDAIPCPKCDRRRVRRGHPQYHSSEEEVDFATPFT